MDAWLLGNAGQYLGDSAGQALCGLGTAHKQDLPRSEYARGTTSRSLHKESTTVRICI